MEDPIITLDEIADEVKIGFNVTADATEDNLAIHNWFRVMAAKHTNNDYTQLLRWLRDRVRSDWKYEMLHDDIVTLDERVSELEVEQAEEAVEKEEQGAF